MKAVYMRALGKKYVEISRELGWKRAQTFTAAERQVARSIAETLDFAEKLRRLNLDYYQKLLAISKREINYDEYSGRRTEFSRKRLALKPLSKTIRRKPRGEGDAEFLYDIGRLRWVTAMERGDIRKLDRNTYEVRI